MTEKGKKTSKTRHLLNLFLSKSEVSEMSENLNPVMEDERIPELLSDEELDDNEIEELEELRRHGLPDVEKEEDEGEYYTLPPSRTEIMRDWTQWRTAVNDLMSDVINNRNDKGNFEAEREILTSPNDSKTPDFFRGEMYIHGQRVKDQYGCVAIGEKDDNDTKKEKKIMEGNFYLFGIPRIGARRSSEGILHITSVSRLDRNSRRPSEDLNCTRARRNKYTKSSSFGDLLDTEQLDEIDERPFQGIAKARRASLSRRSSLATVATIGSSTTISPQSRNTIRRHSHLDNMSSQAERFRDLALKDEKQLCQSFADNSRMSNLNFPQSSYILYGNHKHSWRKQSPPNSTLISVGF